MQLIPGIRVGHPIGFSAIQVGHPKEEKPVTSSADCPALKEKRVLHSYSTSTFSSAWILRILFLPFLPPALLPTVATTLFAFVSRLFRQKTQFSPSNPLSYRESCTDLVVLVQAVARTQDLFLSHGLLTRPPITTIYLHNQRFRRPHLIIS